MPVPALPHELSDHIIDFLHAEPRALSACGLVCRAWLAAARHHRFAATCVLGRLAPFAALLHASPGIAPHVRTLTLDGVAYPLRRRHELPALLAVLGALPALRALALGNLELDGPLVAALVEHPPFKRLTRLSLHRCLFASAADVIALVSASNWEHLAFDELDFPAEDDFGDAPPPVVQSLGLSGLWDPAVASLAQWVISGQNNRSIRTLRARISMRSEAQILAKLLESLGASLQKIDLKVDADTNLEGRYFRHYVPWIEVVEDTYAAVFNESDLSLSCLSALHRCRLEFHLREMFVPSNMSLPWIKTLVTQVTSHLLEEIVISIKADDMQDLRALDSECGSRDVAPVRFDDMCVLDWQKVHDTIEEHRMWGLKQIVVEGQGDASLFLRYIADSWPALEARVRPKRVGQLSQRREWI